MMYKSCGWNTTHTTQFHGQYVSDPTYFFPFPPLMSSGLCLVRLLLRGDAGLRLLLWPFHLLRQL
jgi:hypothetical protein